MEAPQQAGSSKADPEAPVDPRSDHIVPLLKEIAAFEGYCQKTVFSSIEDLASQGLQLLTSASVLEQVHLIDALSKQDDKTCVFPYTYINLWQVIAQARGIEPCEGISLCHIIIRLVAECSPFLQMLIFGRVLSATEKEEAKSRLGFS